LSNADDIKLILMTITATVAFIALIFTVRNRYIDKKQKLEIQPMYRVVLHETDGMISYKEIVVELNILNTGSVPVFIYSPLIFLPRKIDGYHILQIIRADGSEKYPYKLEPRQEFKKQISLRQLVEYMIKVLNSSDNIRFIIKDSTGKSYKSKKVKISELVSQFKR